MVTTHVEEEWRLLMSLEPGPRRRRRLARARAARLQLPARRHRAAIGIGQLEKLDEILALRQACGGALRGAARRVDGLEPPLADDADHTRSLVRLRRQARRAASTASDVIAELERAGGIADVPRYLPSIHLQPYMRERFGFPEGLCPVSRGGTAADACAAVLHRRSTPDDQERVVDALAARWPVIERASRGDPPAVVRWPPAGASSSTRHSSIGPP